MEGTDYREEAAQYRARLAAALADTEAAAKREHKAALEVASVRQHAQNCREHAERLEGKTIQQSVEIKTLRGKLDIQDQIVVELVDQRDALLSRAEATERENANTWAAHGQMVVDLSAAERRAEALAEAFRNVVRKEIWASSGNRYESCRQCGAIIGMDKHEYDCNIGKDVDELLAAAAPDAATREGGGK